MLIQYYQRRRNMATTAYERFLKDQGKDEAVEVDIKEQKPFDLDEVNLSEDSLLDKAIAAIITEDIDLASKIAKNILTEDKNNAEALIITAASFYNYAK